LTPSDITPNIDLTILKEVSLVEGRKHLHFEANVNNVHFDVPYMYKYIMQNAKVDRMFSLPFLYNIPHNNIKLLLKNIKSNEINVNLIYNVSINRTEDTKSDVGLY
jgi:hypothetical protein